MQSVKGDEMIVRKRMHIIQRKGISIVYSEGIYLNERNRKPGECSRMQLLVARRLSFISQVSSAWKSAAAFTSISAYLLTLTYPQRNSNGIGHSETSIFRRRNLRGVKSRFHTKFKNCFYIKISPNWVYNFSNCELFKLYINNYSCIR